MSCTPTFSPTPNLAEANRAIFGLGRCWAGAGGGAGGGASLQWPAVLEDEPSAGAADLCS